MTDPSRCIDAATAAELQCVICLCIAEHCVETVPCGHLFWSAALAVPAA